MANDTVNVFISHVHEDDDGLKKLKDLLAKKGYTIRDSSIDSESPNKAKDKEYIKTQILAPQIKWAGTLIVYITPKTRNSPWVNWEIEYAEKEGKRIVGVWAYGAKDSDLPDALDDYSDAVVPWNSDKIIDAITGKLDGSVTPAGTPPPQRQITRYQCRK